MRIRPRVDWGMVMIIVGSALWAFATGMWILSTLCPERLP